MLVRLPNQPFFGKTHVNPENLADLTLLIALPGCVVRSGQFFLLDAPIQWPECLQNLVEITQRTRALER